MKTVESEVSVAPDGQPEADLIALAKKGDMAAFDELVKSHFRRVFGVAYHMLGQREDAEDVTQAVFIKAHRALDRFRGQSAFSSWLHRIAVNETLNVIKKRKKATYVPMDDLHLDSPEDPAHARLISNDSPERAAHLKDLNKLLNTALQSLSQPHRLVVVLHDLEGMPHDKIADLLGCSAGTVRSRLFYARQLLQLELKEFAP